LRSTRENKLPVDFADLLIEPCEAKAEFDEALSDSKTFDLDGHPIPCMGKRALVANKRAAGGHKDLANVEELERLPDS
jgi:hypothetical protein